MQVLSIGNKVQLENDAIGTIIAIAIRGSSLNVKYEVVWFEGSCRNSEWLESFEIKKKGNNILKIGFTK